MAGYGSQNGRFHPNSPQTPRAQSEARVGDLIAGVVKASGLGKASALDRLQGVWREAVGRKNAAETRLLSLRKGLLTVEVSSSALAYELGVYYKHDLLSRLRQVAKVPVQDLKCVVGGAFRGSSNGAK